jgi:hypothetical protein
MAKRGNNFRIALASSGSNCDHFLQADFSLPMRMSDLDYFRIADQPGVMLYLHGRPLIKWNPRSKRSGQRIIR